MFLLSVIMRGIERCPSFLLSTHDSRIMYRNSLELSVVSNFVLKGLRYGSSKDL